MGNDPLHVDNFKWNIWQVDKEGKMVKWIGTILDPSTAFGWFKSRNLDPSQFRVNNVPPPTGRTPNPSHEVFALTEKDVRQGAELPVRTFEERPGAVKHRPVRQSVQPTRPRAVPKPAAKKVAVPDSPEMKKAKAKAADLLEQHKADEQRDIEEGNTDAVR